LHLIPQICLKILDLRIENANGVADVFVIPFLRTAEPPADGLLSLKVC